MIVGGAYQPMATRIIDELAELEDAALELLGSDDLTASARDRLVSVRRAAAVLGDALWLALRAQPDSAPTFRALIAADRLASRWRKNVLACTAHREALPID